MRKAQVALFAIIAVLIVSSAILAFSLKNHLLGGNEKISTSDLAIVRGIVDSCLESTGERAVSFVSSRGGYFLEPPHSLEWQGLKFSIYRDGEKLYIPTRSELEKSISSFIDLDLQFCIDESVAAVGFEFTTSEVTTQSRVEDSRITIKTAYPITIKIENSSSRIKDFEAVLYKRTGSLYNASETIAEEYAANGICLTCLAEISEKNGFTIDMFDYNDTTIFTLNENSTQSTFTFAVKNE